MTSHKGDKNLRLKTFLKLSCAVLQTGCGFSPLYQPVHTPIDLPQIKINLIANREGQILRNHLLDQLNPYGSPAYPKYSLKVTINLTESQFGFYRDATARRARTQADIAFELVDIHTGLKIYQDHIDLAGSFSTGLDAA